MKIEYVRQLQGSYMRLELEEKISETEREMLSQNRLEGILPMCCQQEDGKTHLRYDITGKLALDELLEGQKADEKILLLLFSGICQVMREVEKYLLSPEGLLLQTDTIFYDHKKETLFFCYCPGEENLQEKLFRLAEYILTKTDHKNKNAVEFAYGLYEELREPAYSLQDLKDYMINYRRRLNEEEIPKLSEKETEEIRKPAEVSVLEKETEQRRNTWKWEEWKEKVWQKMTAWIHPLLKGWIEKKPKTEAIVFEPEEEEVRQGLPTELLAENKTEIQGVLKYEGSSALKNLVITKTPFVIGSDEGCDGVIKAPGISRQHAKITLTDEVYFIEDLNSTNGTKVEGVILSYKTKASIRRNSEIHFANQPFRFL